jgi:hypothetical protein
MFAAGAVSGITAGMFGVGMPFVVTVVICGRSAHQAVVTAAGSGTYSNTPLPCPAHWSLSGRDNQPPHPALLQYPA